MRFLYAGPSCGARSVYCSISRRKRNMYYRTFFLNTRCCVHRPCLGICPSALVAPFFDFLSFPAPPQRVPFASLKDLCFTGSETLKIRKASAMRFRPDAGARLMNHFLPVVPKPPRSAPSRCSTSSKTICGWFFMMRNWQMRSPTSTTVSRVASMGTIHTSPSPL